MMLPMLRYRYLCLLSLCVSGACTKKNDTSDWFKETGTVPANPCAAMDPQRESFQVPISIVLGQGVTPSQGQNLFIEARAYAAWQGIDLIGGEKAFGQSKRDVLFKESRAGLKEKELTIENAMSMPLREVIDERKNSNKNSIDVYFFSELANHESAASAYLDAVEGLTLSPFSNDDSLRDTLNLKDFRPSIFLSLKGLAKMNSKQAASTVVHELGHALGLGHKNDPMYLMTSDRSNTCDPVFSEEEFGIVADHAKDLVAVPEK